CHIEEVSILLHPQPVCVRVHLEIGGWFGHPSGLVTNGGSGMKRTLGVFAVVVAGAFAFFASQQRFVEAQGRGGNTAAQAAAAEARAKQEALEKATPQLQFTEEVLPLVIP